MTLNGWPCFFLEVAGETWLGKCKDSDRCRRSLSQLKVVSQETADGEPRRVLTVVVVGDRSLPGVNDIDRYFYRH